MSKNLYAKVKEYAKQRGGDLLESEYLGYYTPMRFIDSDGNVFTTTWQRMSDNRSFSPFQKIKNKSLAATTTTIEELHEFAKKNKGKCLSHEYLGQSHEYLWETSDGVQFKKTWKYIKKSWGPDKRGKHFSKWSYEAVVSWCQSKGAEFLSEKYITMNEYYTFKDRNGKVFTQKFSTCIYNDDVLHCTRSRGESEIEDFLISLNVDFVKNARKVLDNSSKEIDFWIPSLKIGIEYHGLYWHTKSSTTTPVAKKQRLAEAANIELIQVFENEWRGRKEQVKSFLKSKLNKNPLKVGARVCELKEVPKDDAKKFFDTFHIQSACNSKVVYGLYLNQDLVCAASFGLHHRNSKDLVLSRFVGKEGVTVAGGLSKICKHVARVHGSFLTWVDLRWSSGASWIKNGWTVEDRLRPDYFYLNTSTNKVVTKQSRKKSNVNTPHYMTEREHAKLDGLEQVFDAGKLRLRFSL